MSAGSKMSLAAATQAAMPIIADLAPACERIEIAGSIRRKRPEIGDLEIVAIPKRARNLLGESGDSLLDAVLLKLCNSGALVPLKNGEKYQQYRVVARNCNLDLFLCEEANWGYIFMLRTGSAEWNKKLVRYRREGGMRPAHLKLKDGFVHDSAGKVLPVPSEEELFRLFGLKPVRPEERM